MKVIILCGGKGARLREETEFRPKPMVPIGGRPILWHIMKIYAYYGHKEFILCLGYKGDMIREYFMPGVPPCGSENAWKDGDHSSGLSPNAAGTRGAPNIALLGPTTFAVFPLENRKNPKVCSFDYDPQSFVYTWVLKNRRRNEY